MEILGFAMVDDFYSAVELAKKIERTMLEYVRFQGKIEVVSTLNLYPKEYEEITYSDLLNYYNHMQKVLTAGKLDVYMTANEIDAPPIEEKKMKETVRDETKDEVETKVKEITAASIESAEEVKIAESIEKIGERIKENVAEVETKKKIEEEEFGLLEFEKAEINEREKKEIVLVEEERIKTYAREVPELLDESAQKVASEKYQEIEEHFKREWGGETDESKIKRKMLELTKELFKEKSVNKRDRIKHEIVVLKEMLSRVISPKKGETAGYSLTFLDSLIGIQNNELASAKDALLSRTTAEVETIKKNFYDKMPESEDEKEKCRIYEQFVFELTSLSEKQLPEKINKEKEFLIRKHVSEIQRFIDGLPKDDKKLKGNCEEHLEMIQSSYLKEFDNVATILKKNIDAIIEKAGLIVFKEEEKTREEAEESGASQKLFEINEIDEATLLYYLHSKNLELYKRYERKLISKHEAVHYAKILMAKEKGLSDDVIIKYFGPLTQEEE